MKRLICWLKGHKWEKVYVGTLAVTIECERCNRKITVFR